VEAKGKAAKGKEYAQRKARHTVTWRSSRKLGFFLFLSLLPASTVGATLLVPADLRELSRSARAIVRGRVAALDARWTDDRRTIETLVTIEPEASIKGMLGQPVQFIVPGGMLGRYRSVVVGAPQFVVGRRVIVFLSWHGPSYPYVVGLSQGVFRIEAALDGTPIVVPPPIIAPPEGSTRIVRGDASRRPLPVVEFEQRVRTFAGEAR
jgi:hypothetical protein